MTEHDHSDRDDEVLRHQDQFYILAAVVARRRPHARAQARRHVRGVRPLRRRAAGRARRAGALPRRHALSLAARAAPRRRRPLLLSSTVKEDNVLLAVDLTNPDLHDGDGTLALPRGAAPRVPQQVPLGGVCYERLRVPNYGRAPIGDRLRLSISTPTSPTSSRCAARKRARRGRRCRRCVDGGRRRARLPRPRRRDAPRRALTFDPPPAELDRRAARASSSTLPPREPVTLLDRRIACEVGDEPRRRAPRIDDALGALARRARTRAVAALPRSHVDQRTISTSGSSASVADLHMMITETPDGPYPVRRASPGSARRSAATASSPRSSALARAASSRAACSATSRATQATDHDRRRRTPSPARSCTRRAAARWRRSARCRSAATTAASTPRRSSSCSPARYLRRTGDLRFVERSGRTSSGARLDRRATATATATASSSTPRQTDNGLVQQGWKDSHDSVFHADGRWPRGRSRSARCRATSTRALRRRGRARRRARRPARAREPSRARPRRCAQRFDAAFWCEELGTYALALDGDKRPCRVRDLERGPRALFTGIAEPRARAPVADDADGRPTCFSGWGIRTLDARRGALQPDVVSQRLGLAARQRAHRRRLRALRLRRRVRCGCSRRCSTRAQFVDLHRLPELFCGFPRRPGEGPTLYPVACAPQAWAAGAVFMLLQACARASSIDGARGEVVAVAPGAAANAARGCASPAWRSAPARIDLLLENHPHDVGLTVLRREGEVRVVVVK